jgi:hypothetical protein
MMMNTKKGTEMIWIIIWMVLGLIVLILVLGMVTGKIRLFGKAGTELEEGTKARICGNLGGNCQSVDSCGANREFTAPAAGWIDCPAPDKCCKA